jgi:hypothetical protein
MDADSWHVPLRAVGWLEIGHAYIEGQRPPGLVEKLNVLIDSAEITFQQHHFRGLHDCTLCEPGNVSARLPRSYINLLIPGKHAVFAWPAGITHYLTVLSYLPPPEFVEAVVDCPNPGSPEYSEALRAANAGHPLPLLSWQEQFKKSRKEFDEIIRRRDARTGNAPRQ